MAICFLTASGGAILDEKLENKIKACIIILAYLRIYTRGRRRIDRRILKLVCAECACEFSQFRSYTIEIVWSSFQQNVTKSPF